MDNFPEEEKWVAHPTSRANVIGNAPFRNNIPTSLEGQTLLHIATVANDAWNQVGWIWSERVCMAATLPPKTNLQPEK